MAACHSSIGGPGRAIASVLTSLYTCHHRPVNAYGGGPPRPYGFFAQRRAVTDFALFSASLPPHGGEVGPFPPAAGDNYFCMSRSSFWKSSRRRRGFRSSSFFIPLTSEYPLATAWRKRATARSAYFACCSGAIGLVFVGLLA